MAAASAISSNAENYTNNVCPFFVILCSIFFTLADD